MISTTLSYGPHRCQVGDLWRPDDARNDHPVVVLIHGGFWRQLYTKRLMHRLAKAVVDHRWAAYNVEYRRIGSFGRGGWPETFDDVSDAIDELAGVDGIDHRRIVTCGHSAGGHLALWAGSPRLTGTPGRHTSNLVSVRAAISLAGVSDLVTASRLGLGGGAVNTLMGGSPEEFPERYALGSPASLSPIGIPQFLIHGVNDTTVPPSLSESYVELARSRGDNAEYVPLASAGHMDMIDSHGPAFREIAFRLEQIFSSPPDSIGP
jgi:acetyl esterase/lipase